MIIKPLADGGEGTTDALIEGLNGKRIPLTVTGPFGDPISCYYGYLPETSTAVIEMAAAAGITLSDRHDPLTATTRGVGEMILDAVRRGCRDFIIGIGAAPRMTVASGCSLLWDFPSSLKMDPMPGRADSTWESLLCGRLRPGPET